MELIKELGRRIQKARKEKGLTQQELADLSHVSLKHVQGCERGVKNPSFEVLRAFGKVLNLSLDSLMNLDLPEDEQYSVSTRCVAALIQNVLKKMNALNKDILTCKASLPTYRSTMPVPFANDLYSISDRVGGGYNIELNVYNKAFSIKANVPSRFCFYTGKLNKYQKPILDRIIDGSYKQGQGDIILKKGKIFPKQEIPWTSGRGLAVRFGPASWASLVICFCRLEGDVFWWSCSPRCMFLSAGKGFFFAGRAPFSLHF